MAQTAVSQIDRPGRDAPGRISRRAVAAPLVGGLLILVALIGVIGTAVKNLQPHDISVGLVAPAPVIEQISRSFGSNAPGVFQFTPYPSEDAARTAIDNRSVDGVLVVGAGGWRLIVAGAAGDAVTGVITGAFTNAVRAQGQALQVETVHPFSNGDPHGLILFFLVLALLISTFVVGTTAGLRKEVGLAVSLGLMALYAVLASLVGVGMATWIAGSYGSGVWSAIGLLALTSAAVATVVFGSARLLGPVGVGLAGLIVVLLDLVASGGPVGPQLLPDVYRWLAPGMPAGQLYSGLRGALFFNNAGIAQPIAVLASWLAAGLVLIGLSRLAKMVRERRGQPSLAR
jgi:hypothetical protein